jgi:hypothetical protein
MRLNPGVNASTESVTQTANEIGRFWDRCEWYPLLPAHAQNTSLSGLAAEIERMSAAVIANRLDRVRTDAAAAQVPVTENGPRGGSRLR